MRADGLPETSVITKLRNAYYGWYLLVAAVLCMAVASGLSFWSIGFYVTPLEEQFGWSRLAVQSGIAVSLAVSGIGSPLAGKVCDARGPRFTIIIGTVLTCATYALLATTSSLFEWYFFFSLNAFFRGFMFYIPFQVLISRWFDRKRGRAVGIMATGFSLGVGLVPVMQFIIDEIGWQASFLFAAAVLALVFIPIGLLVVRNHPHDMGLEADGERRPQSQPNSPIQSPVLGGLTVSQAVRTWNFWIIAFAFMTFFFGMFGWMVNGTPVYESFGIPRETVALLMFAGGMGGLISRPTFGYLAERIPSVEVASIGLAAFIAVGMAALLISGGSWVGITIFIGCWFIGSAGGPVLEPLILPKTFGLAHFGAIMGTMFMVETIGQVVAPIAGGYIYDQTGTYDLLLILFMATLIASMGFFAIASKLPRPFNADAPTRVVARVRGLAAQLVARPEPQHQFSNGVQAASANGAGGVEPSRSPIESGTRR